MHLHIPNSTPVCAHSSCIIVLQTSVICNFPQTPIKTHYPKCEIFISPHNHTNAISPTATYSVTPFHQKKSSGH